MINPRTTHLLIRHQEIALKGKNRPDFERRLRTNIERRLKNTKSVLNLSGRFVIPVETTAVVPKMIEELASVSGISAIAPCAIVEPDLERVKNETIEWAKFDLEQNPRAATFAIRARRVDKRFPFSSAEVDMNVGSAVKKLREGLAVNLKRPDVKISIELRQKHALIYSTETTGIKGLPMDSTQRVICLLSGGIDSPVAAYEVMRRGCTPVFVHFHSKPFTSEASVAKVKRLAMILREFSPFPLELWLVPLLDIQKAVRDACNERYRTVHYRRFMMTASQEIANRRGAKALVTGDALGQVASQTLTNLMAIEDGIKYPVFRPLITLDKAQITEKAQKIGTYETSIEPHDDSCVLFAPNRPATQANLMSLREEAEMLPVYDLIFSAVDRAEKILF